MLDTFKTPSETTRGGATAGRRETAPAFIQKLTRLAWLILECPTPGLLPWYGSTTEPFVYTSPLANLFPTILSRNCRISVTRLAGASVSHLLEFLGSLGTQGVKRMS